MNKLAVTRTWRSLALVAVICSATAVTYADSVSTQVSCYSDEASSIGSSNCNISSADGYARDTLQLQASGNYIALSDNGEAVGQGLESNAPNAAGVRSSASVSYTSSTPGPVRQGYIEITANSSFDAEFAYPGLTFSIGSLQGGCDIHLDDCEASGIPVLSLLPSRYYSFTLGEPFAVQLNYTNSLGTEQDSSYSPISGEFTLGFSFWECDLVTPVGSALSDPVAPEPATIYMSSSTLVCFLVWNGAKRRRKIQAE